jgi:glycosyltransferase involved in cell wall biosynthesis
MTSLASSHSQLVQLGEQSTPSEILKDFDFPGGATVLMAVYGGDDAALLRRAIQSVFDNSVQPDQFLLVADGPLTPRLDAVIHEFKDSSLELLRLPVNRGLAYALNLGLQHARYEWIVRADADDVNLPQRFSTQAQFARANPEISIFGAQVLEVTASDKAIAHRRVPLSFAQVCKRVLKRNPLNHMTVCFKRNDVIALGGYPEVPLKEDYALWATAIAGGLRVENIDQTLVRATAGDAMYRRRGGLKYIRSEIEMQRLLMKLGLVSKARAFLTGLSRSAVFALPSSLRGIIYKRLLRQQ